jgi:hypothetical protein
MASKNKWATNWLGIIGIPSNRIIEGTIAANTLIVPEMGRCGAPSPSFGCNDIDHASTMWTYYN